MIYQSNVSPSSTSATVHCQPRYILSMTLSVRSLYHGPQSTSLPGSSLIRGWHADDTRKPTPSGSRQRLVLQWTRFVRVSALRLHCRDPVLDYYLTWYISFAGEVEENEGNTVKTLENSPKSDSKTTGKRQKSVQKKQRTDRGVWPFWPSTSRWGLAMHDELSRS